MKDDKLISNEELIQIFYDELQKDYPIYEEHREGISHDSIPMFSDSKYSMLLYNIRNNMSCIQNAFENSVEFDFDSELNNVKEYQKTK